MPHAAEGLADRTLSPHLAELLRTLPPQLPVPKACDVRQCSRARLYDLLGLGRVKGVKDGRNLRVITESLIADMASLPAADIKPTARLQSRLLARAAPENAPPRPRGRQPRKSETATITA